jgi:hypothetical protein
MFYVGQTVYSESMEMPAIYLGREWVIDKKEYVLSHHILCGGEVVNDWEYCDLAALTSKSGSIFRGDHSTVRFTGRKELEGADFEDMVDHLDDITNMIRNKKLNVLSLYIEEDE